MAKNQNGVPLTESKVGETIRSMCGGAKLKATKSSDNDDSNDDTVDSDE
jgi:hypothetical protein